MAVIEQRAEQRRASRQGTATLGKGQLCMLVGKQAGQAAMGVEYRVTYRLVAQIDAQRQGVDEHAKSTLHTFATLQTSEQYRAKHHAVAAGQLAQHLSPGQVHQACGADTQLPGLLANLAAQGDIQRQSRFAQFTLASRHGQAVRQGRLVDIAQLFAEEGFMGFIARALQDLSDIVAIRHRCRQLCFFIEEHGLQLVAQHLKGHVVHDHVMEAQHSGNPLGDRITGMHQMQQRSLGQVHAWRAGQVLQRNLVDFQTSLTPDHLYRCL